MLFRKSIWSEHSVLLAQQLIFLFISLLIFQTLQNIVDHIYEEHVGEGFMCWGCGKIRKYTDIKHLRECLFQLSEFFDMRNIRTDKKLWYAFQAKRRGQTGANSGYGH